MSAYVYMYDQKAEASYCREYIYYIDERMMNSSEAAQYFIEYYEAKIDSFSFMLLKDWQRLVYN